MATILEFINSNKDCSKDCLTFVKTSSQLNISAEVDLRSSEFHSLKIAVCKFPMIFAAGAKEEGELVIDYNFDKLGRAQSGYVPKIIVLSGINAAKQAKETMRAKGVKNVTAWVGTRAIKYLDVSAADVSVNELQALLYKKLNYAGKRTITAGKDLNYMHSAHVTAIYPFEHYALVNKGGQKFRQRYSFDEELRQISLQGEMVAAVNCPDSSDMPALFDPINNSTTLGSLDGRQRVSEAWTDFGAPGSETNTPAIKLMLNVEEALKTYLVEILKGVWKVVYSGTAVTPPNMLHASIEANIAAKEAKAKNFSVKDFLMWQDKKLSIKASEQFKLVNGEKYYIENFAYIGEPRDISTWFVPLKTEGEMKAASRKVYFAGVPRKQQKATRKKIEAFGSPTSGNGSKGNPHKFVMDADEPDKDMCQHKGCNRSKAHPIHKVK